jgi:hypothetical protein
MVVLCNRSLLPEVVLLRELVGVVPLVLHSSVLIWRDLANSSAVWYCSRMRVDDRLGTSDSIVNVPLNTKIKVLKLHYC